MENKTRPRPSIKTNNDTGFGSNANNYGGRFINRDGTFNLRKEGVPLFKRLSIYHKMLNMPRWKFAVSILGFYIVINILYSVIYFIIGPSQLTGIIGQTPWIKFKELFFFSTETFTTVGYGRINPIGDGANIVAAFEAMNGFLSFAVVTGLIYGRFAKPKSFLTFSRHALIAPYRDMTALMFRFANFKDNHILTNVEIKVSLALRIEENGETRYKFYDLSLERHKIDSLPMNWTVVHPIDENSPIAGFTEEDMRNADAEVYVLINGFDDVYSCYVLQRTSYVYKEMKFGAKF
ncbi:MAG TPA: ion channel, partial [Flavisolibacter sp.]|nr:ion channel [Flavisolibacter sp.]